MARVMTLVMAVFFWAPVVGPPLGKGLVELGSWRYVMAFSVFTAVVIVAWSTRLEETLKPENRRPLTFRSTIDGFRSVTTHPVTLGYTLATMFSAGAFFSFLASSELIFDDVFDQEHWFVPYFSIMAAGMGLVTLLNNRALHRFRARSVALGAGCLQICAAGTMLGLALAAGGRPPSSTKPSAAQSPPSASATSPTAPPAWPANSSPSTTSEPKQWHPVRDSNPCYQIENLAS